MLTQSEITNTTDRDGIANINITNPNETDEIVLNIKGAVSPGPVVKLKGYDVTLGIVIDETIKYRENESLSFHFQKSKRKIMVDGKPFRKFTAR